MSFGFGAFTVGAALLYSAFKNESFMSLILGQNKGKSVAEQGESHPSAETSAPVTESGAVTPTAQASGHGLKIPAGTPKSVAAKLSKGIAKILWMSGRFPYSWGGGHSAICQPGGAGENGGPGFDCSGCWSCVLGVMGILSGALTSGAMAEQFAPGPGKYITLWANSEHVFGRFLGVPFATGHAREAKRGGPAIGNSDDGNKAAYKECHPKGW